MCSLNFLSLYMSIATYIVIKYLTTTTIWLNNIMHYKHQVLKCYSLASYHPNTVNSGS